MIFVTSWDDGHPCDERLAGLLDRYGLKGTFYVPISNRESHAVMSPSLMRALDSKFELGSHTLDHVYLTELSMQECAIQVNGGKQQLEDILGHRVEGFCYPGGKTNRRIRQAVIDAGFVYARGIDNLWIEYGQDRYCVPTTLQFFPHRKQVLLRNYVRGGHYMKRFSALRTLITTKDWLEALILLIDQNADTPHVIHLWGHSWEIDKHGLWPHLDSLLKYVASLRPKSLSVLELLAQSSSVCKEERVESI